MGRWGFATAALVTAVALGAGGCGTADDATTAGGAATGGAVDVVAAFGAEGQALAALGFDADDLDVEPLAAPVPSPAVSSSGAPSSGASSSTGPDGSAPPARAGDRPRRERLAEWRERRQARVLLRKGTLHGEAVVTTKDGGTRTVAVQRGEVTAIDGDSMTVKSADGFTMTWRFGADLRVVERRTTIQPGQVMVGTSLGVAGAKDGDAGVARLIVVPRPK